MKVPIGGHLPLDYRTEVKEDSAEFYVRPIVRGKYYYHYSAHIPRSREPAWNKRKYAVMKTETKNPFAKERGSKDPMLLVTSRQPHKYVIVTNEKDEIVAILK